jgi:Zn-dependent protease with chaperone function
VEGHLSGRQQAGEIGNSVVGLDSARDQLIRFFSLIPRKLRPLAKDFKRSPRSGPRKSPWLRYTLPLALLAAAPQLQAQTRMNAQVNEAPITAANAIVPGPSITAVLQEPLSAMRLPMEDFCTFVEPPQTLRNAGRSIYWRKMATKYDISTIGNRGVGKGLNLYSLARERQLGRAMSEQVEAQTKMLNDPMIVNYVNRVGQNLVRNSDAKVPFTIKVIDNDEVNAFALPGGYFYVNTGLILAADNEAQLAGAMAHEIAHVAARHATRRETKTQIANILSISLIFAGGPAGFAVRQVAGFGGSLGFMKFTRDAEREADLLGIEYEYAAGYDPAEFVHFFEKLKLGMNEKKSLIAKAFSTHPMSDERIRRAQEEIYNLLPARDQYVVSTSEFAAVKAHLALIEHRVELDSNGNERPVLRQRRPDPQQDDSASGRPTLRKHPQP